MLIRITQKLSKKLKTGTLPEIPDDPGPFLEWYANLFTADRLQYILTTEAKSLFSVVLYGRGITDDSRFIEHWLPFIREYFLSNGKRFAFERIIVPNTSQFQFSKTQSRSILGSMNDMVDMAKTMISLRDMSLWEVSDMINETPFSALEGQCPLDALDHLKFIKPV
ncbi:MAG: DUF6933 domain-containing protein [Desulfosudaceae bacterium]